MRSARWAVPLAAAAAGLVVAAGLVRGHSVREPLSPVAVRQDVNPGPCVAVVEVQCFCAEPRLFIVGCGTRGVRVRTATGWGLTWW